jgi:hypothetical protein
MSPAGQGPCDYVGSTSVYTLDLLARARPSAKWRTMAMLFEITAIREMLLLLPLFTFRVRQHAQGAPFKRHTDVSRRQDCRNFGSASSRIVSMSASAGISAQGITLLPSRQKSPSHGR